jgi:hypothetical protein
MADDRPKFINLAQLRAQFAGTRFCELVQHHLGRQSQERRIDGIQGTLLLLPKPIRGLAEGFIDRWNTHAYDASFWQRDTALVFDEIINDARDVLRPFGLVDDNEAAFNLFNIVVLSYAYSAYDQPKMREFMGILSAKFPWASTVALLYPAAATVYIATTTPATPMMVAGYGIANLGYVLLGAGLSAGSFRILGLKKRWHVTMSGVAAFAVGTVLSNIPV